MNELQIITKAIGGIVDIQAYLVGMGNKPESIGERVVKSAQTLAFRNGADLATIELTPREFKSAITGTGAANDPLTIAQLPFLDPGKRRPLRIRDLLPAYPTANGAIELPIKSAATVASPAVQNRENTSFGESAYTFAMTFVPVESIGAVIPTSKQILEDSGTIDAFVQSQLMQDVGETEQNQLLNGTGSNSQLHGLIANATAWANESPNITNEVDIIRSAIKQVNTADFAANAIILNPSDWYDIDTRKAGASDDAYASGTPRLITGPSLWGLPVIETNAIAAGTFLVGDFNRAAVIFDREAPYIELARHHDSNFEKGMISFGCFQRLALVITNATALVTGSL